MHDARNEFVTAPDIQGSWQRLQRVPNYQQSALNVNISIKNQLQRCLRDIAEASNISDANAIFHDRSQGCVDDGGIIVDRVAEVLRDVGIAVSVHDQRIPFTTTDPVLTWPIHLPISLNS